MSNVLLTDKDDWLYLLLFPQSFSSQKTPLVLELRRLMIADCPIVSLIGLLAKLSVILVWIQDITGKRCMLSR